MRPSVLLHCALRRRPRAVLARPSPALFHAAVSSAPIQAKQQAYDRLAERAATGHHLKTREAVRVLIQDHGEAPNQTLYSALLQSCAGSVGVSAGNIRQYWAEMQAEGIEPDAAICHCVLEALAVHPDSILRNEVIDYMEARWLRLTVRGHNFVVAGMLRDRYFELALEKLDQMCADGVAVLPWLYDLATYMLLDIAEVDEAYQLALRRTRSGGVMSKALWSHLLDCSAKHLHAEATAFVWEAQVVDSYLKPPSDTCLQVLGLAASAGNVRLATDVFRVLTERGAVLTQYHYELLLEAHLGTGDLETALSVLVVMTEAGVKSDSGTANPLLRYLAKRRNLPIDAFGILQRFERTGRRVPTAAVNACIEAAVAHGNLAQAVDMYKALHTISQAGPNVATFNALYRGCRCPGGRDLAMFLGAEMVKLRIRPNALTYDRLTLVCLHAGDIAGAWTYVLEARDAGLPLRPGTRSSLVRTLDRAGDAHAEKVNAILKDMQNLGMADEFSALLRQRKRRCSDVHSRPMEQHRAVEAVDSVVQGQGIAKEENLENTIVP